MTVQEFTGEDITEIKVGDTGDYMTALIDLLNKTGANFDYRNTYDEEIEAYVMNFQTNQDSNVITGIINDFTLNRLLTVAESKTSDIIYSEGAEDTGSESTATFNPHYDSFFSSNNKKEARINNQDIVIVLGKNSVTKTIHNVYMRGVSTEYDTSGNPISETYEFIGQDLTESDEPMDKQKYE